MTPAGDIAWTPGLLSEVEAARWLGISATKLRELGLPRRILGRRRLYDLRDLAAFRDELPYESERAEEEAKAACDQAFGLGG